MGKISAKLSLAIFLLLLLSGCGVGGDTKIVFRYDDFSNESPTHLEKKILKLLSKHDASITFGAIPNLNGSSPLDSQKVKILSRAVEEGTVDLAQHGYTHQAIVTKPKVSEFAYLEYNDQLKRLRKGKELLEQVTDLHISTFIPPWNRWDLNTLKALEETGFDNLSSRIGAGKVSRSTPIHFVSGTFNDLPQLRSIIEEFNFISFTKVLMVVVIHPYNFKSVDKNRGILTFNNFSKIVEWVRDEKEIPIMSIEDATETSARFDLRSLQLNKQVRSLLPLIPPAKIPPFESAREFDKMYHSTYASLVIIFSILFITYFSILIFTFVFSYILFTILISPIFRLSKSYLISTFLLFLLVSIYSFHDSSAHWLGVLCSTSALGICIGAILARQYPDWIHRARPVV